MSHWQEGKLNLKCTIDVLHSAIISIMPEWKKSIQISSEGNLSIHSSYAQNTGHNEEQTGFHIRVPENSDIGIRYCDFGAKKLADGTWRIEYDKGGLPPKMKDAPNELKNEVGVMQARSLLRKYNILSEESPISGGGRKIRARVSKQKALQILGQ